MPPRRRSRRGGGSRRRNDRAGLTQFLFNLGQSTGDPTLRNRSVFAIQQAARAAGFKAGNDFFRGVIKGFRGGDLTANQAKAVFGIDVPQGSFRFTASTDGLTGTVRVDYEVEIDYEVRFTSKGNTLAERERVTRRESTVERFTVGRDNLQDVLQQDVEAKQQDIVDNDLKDAQEQSFIAETETVIRNVRVTLGSVSFG